jgi:hypothetical protein
MARKISGGLVGQPSVGAINVAPTAVVTAAQDQNITISPIGDAAVVMTNNVQLDAQNDLRFADADSSNWVAFQAPATIATNVTWTLPTADGSSNQALSTNGSGTLSWVTPNISLSDNTSDSATNYVAFVTATSGTTSSARVSSTGLTFQPSTSTLSADGPVVDRRQDNGQSSSYTIALADRNRVVAFNGAGAQTVTIPNESSVNFPIGSVVYIARVGTGSLTLAADVGVTLTKTGLLAENEELYVRKRASNSWIVVDQPRNPIITGGTFASSNGIGTNTFTSTGSSTLTIGA